MIRNIITRGLLYGFVLFCACTNDGIALRRDSAANALDKFPLDPVVLKVSMENEEPVVAMPDLRVESFEIEENGERQKATAFSREQRPISLLLLIDSSGSMRPVIHQIIAALSRAVRRLKPDDEVALMSFNDKAELYQQFTKNKDLVAEKLQLVLARKPTLAKQALLEAATFMLDPRPNDSRKIVAVVTDNRPSDSGDQVSEKAVMQKLSESDSVLCGIIVAQPLPDSVRPIITTSDITLYVSETGGLLQNMKSFDPADISETFLKVVNTFRDYYRIEYYSNDSKRDGTHRGVKVRLSANTRKAFGKVRLLCRQGYYAPTPGKAK